MAGLCVGCYGLLAGSGPRFLGVPAICVGAALCCAGLALGGRRVRRSRYRPDPWRAPEWVVAACGVLSAAILYLSTGYSAAELNPSFYPLRFPPLPVLPTVAILIAAAAAFAAPPPQRLRPRTAAEPPHSAHAPGPPPSRLRNAQASKPPPSPRRRSCRWRLRRCRR